MEIILGWLVLIILVIGFQFFWWRRLADDYDLMMVVGLGWAVAGGYLLGGVLGVVGTGQGVGTVLGWWNRYLFSPVWGLVLAQIVMSWAAWVRDWKVLTLGENVVEGIYWLTLIIQIVQWVWGSGGLVDLIITTVALGVFGLTKKNYRRWVWYPSGKKGFAFLAVNIVYFLAVAVNWGLAGGGTLELIKTGIMPVAALILTVGLVMLGKQ